MDADDLRSTLNREALRLFPAAHVELEEGETSGHVRVILGVGRRGDGRRTLERTYPTVGPSEVLAERRERVLGSLRAELGLDRLTLTQPARARLGPSAPDALIVQARGRVTVERGFVEIARFETIEACLAAFGLEDRDLAFEHA